MFGVSYKKLAMIWLICFMISNMYIYYIASGCTGKKLNVSNIHQNIELFDDPAEDFDTAFLPPARVSSYDQIKEMVEEVIGKMTRYRIEKYCNKNSLKYTIEIVNQKNFSQLQQTLYGNMIKKSGGSTVIFEMPATRIVAVKTGTGNKLCDYIMDNGLRKLTGEKEHCVMIYVLEGGLPAVLNDIYLGFGAIISYIPYDHDNFKISRIIFRELAIAKTLEMYPKTLKSFQRKEYFDTALLSEKEAFYLPAVDGYRKDPDLTNAWNMLNARIY